MKLATWTPTAMTLRTDMDRLFDSFLSSRPEPNQSSWVPATALLEDAAAYHILVDLPGFSEKELEIEIVEGVLSISGERKRPEIKEDVACHRLERRYGNFRKAFRLGNGLDLEQASASFHDGVLELTLPKSAAAKPKNIPITRD
jgi:HSP20 family protein